MSSTWKSEHLDPQESGNILYGSTCRAATTATHRTGQQQQHPRATGTKQCTWSPNLGFSFSAPEAGVRRTGGARWPADLWDRSGVETPREDWLSSHLLCPQADQLASKPPVSPSWVFPFWPLSPTQWGSSMYFQGFSQLEKRKKKGRRKRSIHGTQGRMSQSPQKFQGSLSFPTCLHQPPRQAPN